MVVNYASSKEGADRVVSEITKQGGKAVAVQGDVSKASDVQRLFAETKRAFGRLDVLVNNAGVYEFSPLADITEPHFHRHFNTNVLGLILATQEAAKLFGPEGGSVINIGSTASTVTPPATTVYTATKGAVDAITRVRGADAARPNREAGRHCADCSVPRLFRFRMADRRNAARVRRTAVEGQNVTRRVAYRYSHVSFRFRNARVTSVLADQFSKKLPDFASGRD